MPINLGGKVQSGLRMIQKVADKAEPVVKRALMSVWRSMGRAITTREAESATRSTRVASQYATSKARESEALVGQELMRASEDIARAVITESYPEVVGVTSLDDVLEIAVEYMKRNGSARLTRVTLETEQAIRQTLASGMRQGLSSKAMARTIRDDIGLTKRQQAALDNYRKGLRKGEMSEMQANAAIAQYAARLKDQRCEVIARTEVMAALNTARVIAWRYGIQTGAVPTDARKLWVTADDERTCPVCAPMSGVDVDVGYVFQMISPDSKKAGLIAPPAHPNCRCYIELLT